MHVRSSWVPAAAVAIVAMTLAPPARADLMDVTAGVKGFAGGSVWNKPSNVPGGYEGLGFAGSAGDDEGGAAHLFDAADRGLGGAGGGCAEQEETDPQSRKTSHRCYPLFICFKSAPAVAAPPSRVSRSRMRNSALYVLVLPL